MSLVSNSILAFSMSADAFAASISKGIALQKPKLSDALRIGLLFGCVEAVTPIIGWVIGLAANQFVASIDHWIAFVILSVIGSKMIYEAMSSHEVVRREGYHFTVLLITAIGTSIDAMAVGVTLAMLDANIWLMAAMIGIATFIMATLGIMTGHYIGKKAGKVAEAIGGICLIAIGTHILLEHLGLLA